MATQILFLFLFLSGVHAQYGCISSYCYKLGPAILFPFWLQDMQPQQQPRPAQNCRSPGFNLSCIGQKTYLNIPYSGDFYVDFIDYSQKMISLTDPSNCLASRLLIFNLSSSPFMAARYENFTFYSCPKAQTSSVGVIDCLSNSSTTIVAKNNQDFFFQGLSGMCKKILSVRVPVRDSYLPGYIIYEFPAAIVLTWIPPNISGTGSAAGTGVSSDWKTMLVIPALVIPALIIIISCCICMRRRDHHESSHPFTQTTQGLDESTIKTYKKVTISENRHIMGSDDITCAICLEDYVPNDTLRFIPECEHCFHVKCIDEWLRVNSICPICRINLQAHIISPC